jgi:predicted PurR-regulated permease PerM
MSWYGCCENINDALIVFFRGQVLVAMCDGVLYTVGFLAIGLPVRAAAGLVGDGVDHCAISWGHRDLRRALLIAIAVIQYGDWQHPALVLVVFVLVQGSRVG